MQNQVEVPAPQPPPPPAAPRTIRIESSQGGAAQTISIPLSAGEVRELRARRSELSDQLSRANNRRANIVSELDAATGANRAGLEQRLTQLDQRIFQLESEITATEQAVAGASTGLLAAGGRTESPGGEPEARVIIPSVFIVFVAFPLAVAYARRIWKRSSTPRVSPTEAGRLERIEQAVEAIAIEVERVSEGQRFVTKLLSDTNRAALSLPADR